jgi:hypothetical protein
MTPSRGPRDQDASPIALHLALWIPFAILVVVAWFTVVAPELASDPSGDPPRPAATGHEPSRE